MDSDARATISALEDALHERRWTAAVPLLRALPATGAAGADAARAAADAVAEAVSFSTAFEGAFAARRALVAAGAVAWFVSALRAFARVAFVVRRVAAVLRLLGMGDVGRSAVGAVGGVDLMAVAWGRHGGVVELVRALVSLCAGHIDNVSRAMRRRAVGTAVRVLADGSDDVELVEQTLLFLGMCAVATPDIPEERDALVPALLDALKNATARGLPDVAAHAMAVLGNVGECAVKEGSSYTVSSQDTAPLVVAIAAAWGAFPRNRAVASAASWALTALDRCDAIDVLVELDAEREVPENSLDTRARALQWKDHVSSSYALCDLLDVDKEMARQAPAAKRRRTEAIVVPKRGDCRDRAIFESPTRVAAVVEGVVFDPQTPRTEKLRRSGRARTPVVRDIK